MECRNTEDVFFTPGKWQRTESGEDCTLLAVGSMVKRAGKIRETLLKKGISAEVWNCSTVKPLDLDTLKKTAAGGKPYFTIEEHMLSGGFGAYILKTCEENGLTPPAGCFGIRDEFIGHGAHERLMEDAGLDAETIAEEILRKTGRQGGA